MKVTFYQRGCFEVLRMGEVVDTFPSLDAAMECVSERFPEGQGEVWTVICTATNEVIAKFEDEDCDGYECDWSDDEMGYNPYMGCYDFDC